MLSVRRRLLDIAVFIARHIVDHRWSTESASTHLRTAVDAGRPRIGVKGDAEDQLCVPAVDMQQEVVPGFVELEVAVPPDACRVVGVGQRPSCSTRRGPPHAEGYAFDPARRSRFRAARAGHRRARRPGRCSPRGAARPRRWDRPGGAAGSLLDADVQRLVGPKGCHNPQRAAVRHGTQPGRVTLGGRRVRVDRPRVRSADGTAELPLATWQAFASTELLDQLTLERMLAKLSTRRYHHGLEPVGSRGRTGELGDLQVGGVAPVRRRHRACPGRAAGRRSVRPGPGGAAGRRHPRGRPHLRGRAGDHPGRHQDSARPGRGRHREHHRGG